MDDVTAIIDRLELRARPEGGWYRETWRGAGADRSAGTAILFLLEQGMRSHWHRIDATELWLFHAGSPLVLATATPAGERASVCLGPDVLAGDRQQHVVDPGCWQSAKARFGWSLVACVVVPGFDFAGFELAPPGWSPG